MFKLDERQTIVDFLKTVKPDTKLFDPTSDKEITVEYLISKIKFYRIETIREMVSFLK